MRNIVINGTSVSYSRIWDRFKVEFPTGMVEIPARLVDWGSDDPYREAYNKALEYKRHHRG